MGCPSEVEIGDNLVFSVVTHDPDTGAVTDADSVPTYRVYEDETGTAILTGSMAKLDDANTTGFYTELIACTAANGFENGKSYTVYIEATVDSDTGGISYGFAARTPVWSRATRTLTQSAASVTAVVSGSDITVTRGDSWSISLTGLGSIANRSNTWFSVKGTFDDADTAALVMIDTTTGLLYLNGAAAATAANGSITIDDEDDGDITIALDEVESAKLTPRSKYKYDVQVRRTTNAVNTLTSGDLTVSSDVTRATS
jgi:hypothetical protein